MIISSLIPNKTPHAASASLILKQLAQDFLQTNQLKHLFPIVAFETLDKEKITERKINFSIVIIIKYLSHSKSLIITSQIVMLFGMRLGNRYSYGISRSRLRLLKSLSSARNSSLSLAVMSFAFSSVNQCIGYPPRYTYERSYM